MGFWSDVHHAICTTLKSKLPQIQTCMAYPILRQSIQAPLVLIELSHLEPTDDYGTEQLMLTAQFEARVVVDSLIPDAQICIRALAVDVASVIHLNTWGQDISPAKIISISPDGFKPELDAYVVWTVTWSHTVLVGDSIWATTDVTPHTLHIGS